jgi:two-component sensor histidine kinase/ActR/RegA family two-component response regulator
MLRRQTMPLDPMSFLSGTSEMAKRIRDFDWSAHPFGPPSVWPQSLRSALSICLQSAFPTAIYWGPELRLLYNDAWAPIPGPRHPMALGAPAQEVWSDIWHIIEPQLTHLIMTGEGIFVEDQLLPMRRFGTVEETYWSYSFTPVRGEDGAIAGVYNAGSETTANVIARRQMSFLLELNEVFRTTSDPAEARRTAIRMLGEHLAADRVGIRLAEPGGGDYTIVDEWAADGVQPVGNVPIEFLGELGRSQLMAGRALRIDDVAQVARARDARPTFEELGIAAALGVPWMDRGRALAIIFVHDREPRAWTDFDVKTVEEVLERTLGWMERQTAAERERTMMREIDHRARNTLAVVKSLVRRTHADNVDALRAKITARLDALARTHDLLSAERWQAIGLKALVADELAPFADPAVNRVVASGPPVNLNPEQAQTVALLLHELATNATKHGALSAENGTLEVRWSVPEEGMLEINWSERLKPANGPLSEPTRTGFGATLLRRVVEEQLGGRVTRSFEPYGLRCRLEIPLDHARIEPTSKPQGGSNTSVLIVEDEALLAMDLVGLVEDLGLTVFATAASVKDALASLENSTPDLAILDVNLQGASSEPVARTLLERDVPVILATGYAAGLNGDGLSDLPRLTKPVTADDVRKAILDLGVTLDPNPPSPPA